MSSSKSLSEAVAQSIQKQLKSQNTLEEKQKDEQDKALLILKYLRPYLIKLLLHMILIYLSIRAFNNYRQTADAYQSFKDTLNKEVISDVKIINYSAQCPSNYIDISFSYFPEVKDGCRCDFTIFAGLACEMISENFWNETLLKDEKEKYCEYLDKQMKRVPYTKDASSGSYTKKRILEFLMEKEFHTNNYSNNSQQNENLLNHENKSYYQESKDNTTSFLGYESVNKARKRLSQKYEFNMKGFLPSNCNCYKEFKGIPRNKTIDRFFANKRICIKKLKNISTLKYLETVEKECPDNLRCQNYFCAKDFPDQTCPLVDIYATKIIDNYEIIIQTLLNAGINLNDMLMDYTTITNQTTQVSSLKELIKVIETTLNHTSTGSSKTSLKVNYTLNKEMVSVNVSNTSDAGTLNYTDSDKDKELNSDATLTSSQSFYSVANQNQISFTNNNTINGSKTDSNNNTNDYLNSINNINSNNNFSDSRNIGDSNNKTRNNTDNNPTNFNSGSSKTYSPTTSDTTSDTFSSTSDLSDLLTKIQNMVYRYEMQDSANIAFTISTIYNKYFHNTEYFENSILLPMLNVRIARNGRCNLTPESQINIDYSAITDIECPVDQQIHNFYSLELKEVLNANDNYFDYLNSTLPLFDILVNQDVKWNLGVEYAFHRKTVGCLLAQYDSLNKNGLFPEISKGNGNQSSKTSFDIKREKLKNLLIVFINFKTSYVFQDSIQLVILILNSIVVLFNVLIILHKILQLCFNGSEYLNNFFSYEWLISFSLDNVIAVLGAVSYFILGKFSEYLDQILASNCIDNYFQFQFSVFNETLQNTLEQNLQIFIFMIFKIWLIKIFTVFYMCYRKCKFRCKSLKRIIIENINEGENIIDIRELKSLLNGGESLKKDEYDGKDAVMRGVQLIRVNNKGGKEEEENDVIVNRFKNGFDFAAADNEDLYLENKDGYGDNKVNADDNDDNQNRRLHIENDLGFSAK